MRLMGSFLVLGLLTAGNASAQPELDAYRDCASHWAETHVDPPDSAALLAEAALEACPYERKTMLASYAAADMTEELSASYLASVDEAIQDLLIAQITRWRR